MKSEREYIMKTSKFANFTAAEMTAVNNMLGQAIADTKENIKEIEASLQKNPESLVFENEHIKRFDNREKDLKCETKYLNVLKKLMKLRNAEHESRFLAEDQESVDNYRYKINNSDY